MSSAVRAAAAAASAASAASAAAALPALPALARLKRTFNLVTSAQESGIRMLTNYLLDDDVARTTRPKGRGAEAWRRGGADERGGRGGRLVSARGSW